MTMPLQPASDSATKKCLPSARLHPAQHGVVLIISLILLVVISLLAVTSMRNAGSSESVASNVRRTELATEAAEIALRFCEEQVLTIMGSSPPTTTPTPATTPATPIILAPTDPPKWQDKSTSTGWDSKDSPAAVSAPLLDSKVNPAGIAKTYQRPPECMIEMQFPPGGISTNLTRTSSFVITARGFGPEVLPADSARSRPQGSEAWLQSHIQIQ